VSGPRTAFHEVRRLDDPAHTGLWLEDKEGEEDLMDSAIPGSHLEKHKERIVGSCRIPTLKTLHLNAYGNYIG
jgi:hypothetical protein